MAAGGGFVEINSLEAGLDEHFLQLWRHDGPPGDFVTNELQAAGSQCGCGAASRQSGWMRCRQYTVIIVVSMLDP